ncbi:hypothetical protein [Scandinavium sp.]|uniref:hypothetical protein n=1 Tax=Scandinavium sp. TaxID=2830653 RepID=UPI00289DAA5C|nr:hypothetical protein [Scandinavium sp.]
MPGVTAASSQAIRDIYNEGVHKTANATGKSVFLDSVTSAKMSAEERFLHEPHITIHARDLFHAAIPKRYITELNTAPLSEEGHAIKKFLGLISEEVVLNKNSEDIAKFQKLCMKLSATNGRPEKERKLQGDLTHLAQKYGKAASENIVNTYVSHCVGAWVKYHNDRGIDVTDKPIFNEQFDGIISVCKDTMQRLSGSVLPWERMTQEMEFLAADCTALSKTMVFHDVEDAPPPAAPAGPQEPAEPKPDDAGEKYLLLGGADKGGITLHIDNSNRNGDVTNTTTGPDARHAPEDPTSSMMGKILGSDLSKEMRFELAKAFIDTLGGNRIINVVEKVQPYQPAARSVDLLAPPGNKQDEAGFEPVEPAVKHLTQANENRVANNRVIRDERLIRSETDRADNGRDRGTQTQAQKHPEKPVTTSQTTSINDVEQLRSTERTVNRFTRHQPVHVQHYAPLNLPAETPKALKSVAGASMTSSQTGAETALKKTRQNDADRLASIDTKAAIVEGETVLTARLVQQQVQQLPEVSFPERVSLADDNDVDAATSVNGERHGSVESLSDEDLADFTPFEVPPRWHDNPLYKGEENVPFEEMIKKAAEASQTRIAQAQILEQPQNQSFRHSQQRLSVDSAARFSSHADSELSDPLGDDDDSASTVSSYADSEFSDSVSDYDDLASGVDSDVDSEVSYVNVPAYSRNRLDNNVEPSSLAEKLKAALEEREKRLAQEQALELPRNQSARDSQPGLPLQSVVDVKAKSAEFRPANLAGVNHHHQTEGNSGEKTSPDNRVFTTIRTHNRWDYKDRPVNHFAPMNQPVEVDIFKRRTDAPVNTVLNSAAVKEDRDE